MGKNWLLLLLAVAGSALCLIATEAGLRLFGYGYRATFFIRTEDKGSYTSNRQFGWQFYHPKSAIIPEPVRFSATKSADTLRIFILGESAAAGSPDPSFSFPRILEMMLRQQFPKAKFEFVNAAMRGINSHIVLRIARDCARHQPDLIIIYTGNNEFVAFHTREPGMVDLTGHRRLFRIAHWAKATRVSQLFESTVSLLLKHSRSPRAQDAFEDMEFFRARRLPPDDPRRQRHHQTFRGNFSEICSASLASGGKVIVSTVAVNLRDCAPLGSAHRAGMGLEERSEWERIYHQGIEAENTGRHGSAIGSYEAAARIDGTFADLRFRLARCYLADGQTHKAITNYDLARDWDGLQFRADARVNEAIRKVASGKDMSRLALVDTERALKKLATGEDVVPGETLFHDHVHFTFRGAYLVAKTLLPAVASALVLGAPARDPPSPAECADLLAYTAWDELNALEQMLKLTAQPPFTDQLEHAERQSRAKQRLGRAAQSLGAAQLAVAVQTYRQAIARTPNDWQLYFNFARLSRYMQDYRGAAEAYRRALELFPNLLAAKLGLGFAYLEAGQLDEAIHHFAEAVRIDPHSRPAWRALGEAAQRRQTQGRPAAGSLESR